METTRGPVRSLFSPLTDFQIVSRTNLVSSIPNSGTTIDLSLLLKPASCVLESSRRNLVYFFLSELTLARRLTIYVTACTTAPPLPLHKRSPRSYRQRNLRNHHFRIHKLLAHQLPLQQSCAPDATSTHLFTTTTPIMPSCPADGDLVLPSMLAWRAPTRWKTQRCTWKRWRATISVQCLPLAGLSFACFDSRAFN